MLPDIADRVRIVGRNSAATGHLGTVLLAASVGDDHLVESYDATRPLVRLPDQSGQTGNTASDTSLGFVAVYDAIT